MNRYHEMIKKSVLLSSPPTNLLVAEAAMVVGCAMVLEINEWKRFMARHFDGLLIWNNLCWTFMADSSKQISVYANFRKLFVRKITLNIFRYTNIDYFLTYCLSTLLKKGYKLTQNINFLIRVSRSRFFYKLRIKFLACLSNVWLVVERVVFERTPFI